MAMALSRAGSSMNAPPLISTREELAEMAAKAEAVLADASARFYEG